MVVGSRIKDARVGLGLSQEQLGNLIGVSKVSVCGYEQGTRTPTIGILLDLVKMLDVDINYLLGLDVSAAAEDNKIAIRMRKEDLKILSELKKNKKLYSALLDDPSRTIKLINKKLYK